MSTILTRTPDSGEGSSTAWEQAYLRFETPAEECAKFVRRLRALGATRWDRRLSVLELFCGRGNGLRAWRQLGFVNVEGLDLSPTLAAEYRGPGRICVGDARHLPYGDASADIIAIQGGLHHLRLMEELEQVAGEIRRVLKPGGRLVVVEPWNTLFLRCVHRACHWKLLRACWRKLDALAVMIAHERVTYEDWLSRPREILTLLHRTVQPEIQRIAWGKLTFVGRRTA